MFEWISFNKWKVNYFIYEKNYKDVLLIAPKDNLLSKINPPLKYARIVCLIANPAQAITNVMNAHRLTHGMLPCNLAH